MYDFKKYIMIGLLCVSPILLGGDCGEGVTEPDWVQGTDCVYGPSPDSASFVEPPKVRLTWGVPTQRGAYRLAWYTDRENTHYNDKTEQRIDSITVLEPYQMYYWYVQGFYSLTGVHECNGSVWSFNTGGPDCYEPTPVQPPNKGLIETKTVTLGATPIEDTKNYQYRIKIGLDRDNLDWACDTSSSAQCEVSNLIEDTLYYWQAWKVDGSVEICGSLIWEFRTGLFNCQFDPSPAHDDTVWSRFVTLDWEAPVSGPSWTWKVEIAPDNQPFEEIEGSPFNVTEAIVTDLIMDTSYVWRVTTLKNGIETCTGTEWSFHTRLPDPPHTPTPGDYATQVPEDVVLTWEFDQPSGDTYLYNVNLWEYAGPLITGLDLTDPTFDPGGLPPSTSWSWNVLAHNTAGDTLWSESWQFRTVDGPPEGVYANLLIETEWYDEWMSYDNIRARFDSAYHPTDTVKPLQADSVLCNNWKLNWSSYSKSYDYGYVPGLFVLGDPYTFRVYGNSDVPGLSAFVNFPSCRPEITSPTYPDTVHFAGFEVQWNNTCVGEVILTIMDGNDSTAVRVVTDNDGSYPFSQSDLASLGNVAKNHYIVIIVQKSYSINVAGYDPRSTITARSYNKVFQYIE